MDERYFRAIDKSNGKKLEDLQFCIDEFEKLGDWKDSIKYKEECIDKVIQILSTAEKQSENGDSKKTVIPIKREPMDPEKKKRMIIIGAIVICVAIACGVAISAISAAKAYEDIAGVYEFSSIEVLDPFDYPGDGAGNCNIKSNGHIEFPYYDGAFKMASGKLTEYTGIDGYEYEVLIQGEGPRHVYINIYGGSMEIHMESRQDFISGAVFFRELIFNFYK